MSERHMNVVNGRIVRPGIYRPADGSGERYAKKVSTGMLDADCVFCPEALKQRSKIVDEIASSVMTLYVIEAQPAYAHFDGQKIVDHKLIIPEEHIEKPRDIPEAARRARDEYIYKAEDHTPRGTAVQSYTRNANNPSKSVGHLHTHLFTLSYSPLAEFSYDIENGVTSTSFVEPTDEQIEAIEQSRRHL